MKTKEELAKEFANNLENITDIKCPRDVINPGLWYGFMKGYEIAEEEYQEVTMWTPEELSQLLNTKDYLETKNIELKEKIRQLEIQNSEAWSAYEQLRNHGY